MAHSISIDPVLASNGDYRGKYEDSVGAASYPFVPSNKSLLRVLSREATYIMSEPQAKKYVILILLNIVCTFILLIWCHSTDSMSLTAYTYLTVFDIFYLLTCLLTLWVQKQHPTLTFSFGYERFEVLAVFSSTMLAVLGSFFIIKESVERMLQQPDIHEGRLLLGTALAFFVHILVSYSTSNRAFNYVISASSSSWLQEHVADISESLCRCVPHLSKILLPRINPFALLAFAGAASLMATYLMIDIYNYHAVDTWCAVFVAMATCGTMFPMATYSGKILLQTTPGHIIGQLDKCLRETSTLDGVLEFRNEHFWTLSFGKLAGSLQVRIRRDAQEQMVLAHVFDRLSSIVTELTIQVFKDDWTRGSSGYHISASPGGSTSVAGIGLSPAQISSKIVPCSDGHQHSHSHNAGHSHSHNAVHAHSPNVGNVFNAGHSHNTGQAYKLNSLEPLTPSTSFSAQQAKTSYTPTTVSTKPYSPLDYKPTTISTPKFGTGPYKSSAQTFRQVDLGPGESGSISLGHGSASSSSSSISLGSATQDFIVQPQGKR